MKDPSTTVIITKHYSENLAERSLNTSDVLYLLRDPVIEDDPEWCDEHQRFKYKVTGYTPTSDSRRVTIVIAPYFEDNVLVFVTVFWVDEKQSCAGSW